MSLPFVRSFVRQVICPSLLFALTASLALAADGARDTRSFDAGWRFLKGDAPEAWKTAFDDAAWRVLDVPHDWSIEGPVAEDNPTRGSGGFAPAGMGWYRKHFTLPPDAAGKRVFVDFDGVMANSDVWINGEHVNWRPYGYVSFRCELTGHLTFSDDKPNVLSVRADNAQQPASRWYAGAGIYRHVRLVIADPVHLENWGTFVTTPEVANDHAAVRVRGTVVNQSDKPREVSLQISLLGPDGQQIQTAETTKWIVAPGKSTELRKDFTVAQPQRWDIDKPVLYRAVTKVMADGKALDEETTPFGIREFEFKPETGFWLNGRNFKLKGVCLHHDGGAFGAAVPARVWEDRLTALKALGVNAIRTSHNPVAPEFLDLCDKLGLLVMDEMFDCWNVAKNPYDYHLDFKEWAQTDTRDTVRRDRNHPSIILYSAGNEIHDTPNAEVAKSILGTLVDAFHDEDPTRPVTQALFRPNASHDYTDGLADLLDVVGQNYREREILAAHADKPARKIVGTENQHDRSMWLPLRDNAPYAGQFLWTGIDYLGEAARWPAISRPTGLMDRAGRVYPRGRQRQSWWSEQPMVSVARRTGATDRAVVDPGYEAPPPVDAPPPPRRSGQVLFSDWTPASLEPHTENLEVYSNAEQVELTLNGKSLGSRPLPADASPRLWQVPFEPGTLTATARNKDQIVATQELRTAGKPAKIVLAADHSQRALSAGKEDVCFVRATVVDEHDVPVPTAADLISFKTTGEGSVAAVDNGDVASHESYQASERHAYQGECVAILQAKAAGKIMLEASAPGLSGAAISIETTAAQ